MAPKKRLLNLVQVFKYVGMLRNDSFEDPRKISSFLSAPTIKGGEQSGVIDYEICFSKDPIKIYYAVAFTATRGS